MNHIKLLSTAFMLTFMTSFVSAQVEIEIKLDVTGNDVNMFWVASNQSDIELYRMERSVDGRNWFLVVNRNGDGLTSSTYEFVDQNLADGEYAYRLTAINSNNDADIIGYEIVKINVSPVITDISNFPDAVRHNPINE